MEKDVTICLKSWHKRIHKWKQESLAGMMPIHIASFSGNNKVFRFIAAFVENPNPAKCDGFTPLHLAAEFGNTKIIKFLVSQIENINDITPNGWTPINLAARYGNTEIFKLLAAKVDFNIQKIKLMAMPQFIMLQ